MLRTAVIAVLVAAACGDAGTAPEPTADPSPATTATTAPAVTTASAYDLQGHRGARGLRPENTLPSFEAALDLLVTTLEADLHFSADGQAVVWHDPVIDAGKCGVGPDAPAELPDPDAGESPAVRELTAAELAGYRCDRNPDPSRFPEQVAAATAVAGDAYRIVTLKDLFDFVAEYAASSAKTDEQRANAALVRFNIETKRVADDPTTIGDGFDGATAGPFELAVLDAVTQAGVAERTTIQSFDHRSLWAVAATGAPVTLAALTSRGGPDFGELAERGAAIWSPRFTLVTPTSLAAAQTAGLAVIPWTVNEPADMQRLLDLGVDGLITDRPDLAPGWPP